jgi:hypothetical protein
MPEPFADTLATVAAGRTALFVYHPPGFRPAVTAMVAAWTLFVRAALRRRHR